VRAGTVCPTDNIEALPRNPKDWLSHQMESGYKPSTDQEPLTRLLVQDLSPLRARNLRSFRRLENALRQLTEAIRAGKHIVTPAS
jgi:hypothetical protein